MLTCTHRPDVIRVSFTAPVAPGDLQESEIVCFLRVVPTGLEINYAHHVMRVKSGTLANYDEQTEARLPLTPALIARIQEGVMYEFWSSISRSIRVLPAPITAPLELIDFEQGALLSKDQSSRRKA